MDAEQGDVEECLSDEVAIRDRVERVLESTGESKGYCGAIWVEWERRASECSSAEWRDIHAFIRSEQTIEVASECPRMRRKMVREQDRLSSLKVRVSREILVTRCLGTLDQDLLEHQHATCRLDDGSLRPETECRGDLIVAGAPSVQLRPGLSRDLGDPALDDGVNVLVLGQDLDRSVGDLAGDDIEGLVEG